MKKSLFCLLSLASVLVLSGCVARTYPLTRDRIDQDLNAGNRGYLQGNAPADTGTRKDTREVRVFEIEFGRSYKTNKATAQQNLTSSPETVTTETVSETVVSEPEPEAVSSISQKYTVEKNDTLQKISKKFYGTTKKWVKIYQANKDTLSGPDKVYPGQILNIPDISDTQGATGELKEPQANLK
jgi:LysM repeat protein